MCVDRKVLNIVKMLAIFSFLCLLQTIYAFTLAFQSKSITPCCGGSRWLKTTTLNAETSFDQSADGNESSEIRRLRTKLQDTYDEIAKLQEDNESEKASLKKLDDEFGSEIVRIKKEFARMKERAIEESESLVSSAIAEALKDVLPLSDNYFRAKKAYEPFQTDNEKKIFDAYATIFSDFNELVQSYGLTKMECVGQKFDANFMEAVVAQPSEYPPDIVCAEFQIGYKIGEKLVRPAVVAVSTGM